MWQSVRKNYRQAVDHVNVYLRKYFIEHVRYNTVKFNTKYRHQKKAQYLRTAVGMTLASYAFFNVVEIENHDRYYFAQYFKTEYIKLIEEVRSDKNDDQTAKAVYDLIKKGKQSGLSSIEILALSEIIKKPELNLHAEYLASLK